MIITLVKSVFMCIYREGLPSQLYFAHCVKSPLAIIQMHLAAVKLATLFYGDIPFVFSFGPTELGKALVLNAPWSEDFFFYGAPGCSSVVNQNRNVPGIFLETAQCTCGLAVGLFFSLRAVRSLAGHVCVVKRQ